MNTRKFWHNSIVRKSRKTMHPKIFVRNRSWILHSLLWTIIQERSPQYCTNNHPNFCTLCMHSSHLYGNTFYFIFITAGLPHFYPFAIALQLLLWLPSHWLQCGRLDKCNYQWFSQVKTHSCVFCVTTNQWKIYVSTFMCLSILCLDMSTIRKYE